MVKASDNAFPSLLITEGTEPSAPAAGKQRLYIDSTTHLLKATNSSGTDRTIEGIAAGAITSSGLTQATARLLGRTTASTGAVEEITVGAGLTLSAGSLTATGGGGSWVWLQRQTASNSATLDFTSFISSTYTEYVFKFIGIVPASNAMFTLRAGTGGGPTYDTGSVYPYSNFWKQVGTTAAVASWGTTATAMSFFNDSAGAGLSSVGAPAMAGTMNLFDPASSANKKLMTWEHQMYYSGDATFYRVTGGGYYNSATAVTAIRFLMSTGNITSGTIDVYGLTHA